MRATCVREYRVLAFIFILLSSSGISFGQTPRLKSWEKRIGGVGIFSSPRISDLNHDGVGDIIIGLGREEFKPCDSAVVALNGRTGQMLWHVASSDHIFTSAIFKDINADGIDDIFMAGRSTELFAINGSNGSIIWRFDRKQGNTRWFNFYNGQFIDDQDNDGTDDIIIANGGNVRAAPYETKDRHPGHLVVISGMTGKLLAVAEVPDGKETYMSPVPKRRADGDYDVLFGTGGETIGGGLYLTKLSDIMKGDIRNSELLDRSPSKGYIGPPLWADINGDRNADIIANAVEGKCIAFDGVTHRSIWTVKLDNTEAYSSIAPGYFTGDDNVPDFFLTYAVGTWPDLGSSKQCLINGASGQIAFIDSLGTYQTSTPVVIDVDEDGIDEALMNVNIEVLNDLNQAEFQNVLTLVDFKNKEVLQLGDASPGSNISSTPWIGDLDKDGLLDIVYCHGTNIRKTYSFSGIQVHRVATGINAGINVRWGAYMGSQYNAIFTAK
ncbi:hypothetical protein WBG78_17810 [Chryseolinea sp. T2]|uniref:hypothetical protein n=1 Tax=Chryseolinea sp. T2 TaxID=3129255 RepID=UPI0030774CFC